MSCMVHTHIHKYIYVYNIKNLSNTNKTVQEVKLIINKTVTRKQFSIPQCTGKHSTTQYCDVQHSTVLHSIITVIGVQSSNGITAPCMTCILFPPPSKVPTYIMFLFQKVAQYSETYQKPRYSEYCAILWNPEPSPPHP